MNMRASLDNFCVFTFKIYYFLKYSVGTYDTLSQKHIFSGLKLHNYYTINAVSFYYLWYGTMYKRQYIDKTLTLWKSMYMRASGASEIRKCWHFYIIKVLFLSIWMGRNNHLQITILKHIVRMHKHDFCGEQSIYTRTIYWQIKKYVCMIFFFCVCVGGGGHVPPPRSYAPERDPEFGQLFADFTKSCQIDPTLGHIPQHVDQFLGHRWLGIESDPNRPFLCNVTVIPMFFFIMNKRKTEC